MVALTYSVVVFSILAQGLSIGYVTRKAITQVYDTVFCLVKDRMAEDQARALALTLSDGRWTHDYPISPEQAKELGMPVSHDMPRDVYALMDLYPQSGLRRPSVEFIPGPYLPPTKGPGHTRE